MPCPSWNHQSWNYNHFFCRIWQPSCAWSKMKLNRAKSVCDQRWKACLGVLLASALAFAATHRCGHLLHYVFTSIVLLGGIARYWRPGHLGVGDHRPLVILLRKQVKFNPEVWVLAVSRRGRWQDFFGKVVETEIFLGSLKLPHFPKMHINLHKYIGMVMNRAVLEEKLNISYIWLLVVLEAIWYGQISYLCPLVHLRRWNAWQYLVW